MTIGEAIEKDIRERFTDSDFANEVGEEAGRKVMRSIERQTSSSQDPSGASFEPLADFYAEWKSKVVGSDQADLRSGKRFPDGGSKPEALDELMFEPDGNEINFNFGGYGEAEEYMAEHQRKGLGDPRLPERRWFPESEQDDGSPPQKRLADEIAEVLEDFLNDDRTIKAKLVVSGKK